MYQEAAVLEIGPPSTFITSDEWQWTTAVCGPSYMIFFPGRAFSRLDHLPICIRAFCLLIILSHWMYNLFCSIVICGFLRMFPFWGLMNGPVKKVHDKFPRRHGYVFISFHIYLEVEMLTHKSSGCLPFWDTTRAFSKEETPVYIITNHTYMHAYTKRRQQFTLSPIIHKNMDMDIHTYIHVYMCKYLFLEHFLSDQKYDTWLLVYWFSLDYKRSR